MIPFRISVICWSWRAWLWLTHIAMTRSSWSSMKGSQDLRVYVLLVFLNTEVIICEGVMPNLKRLSIHDCAKLKKVPHKSRKAGLGKCIRRTHYKYSWRRKSCWLFKSDAHPTKELWKSTFNGAKSPCSRLTGVQF